VIVRSAIERGATTSVAALISALIGIGSIVTNIPSGIIATRLGERKAMLIASAIMVVALAFCLIDIGSGSWPLMVYGFGTLLIGAASSVYNLARQSFLTDMVPPHMRALRSRRSAARCASVPSWARSWALVRCSCGAFPVRTTSVSSRSWSHPSSSSGPRSRGQQGAQTGHRRSHDLGHHEAVQAAVLHARTGVFLLSAIRQTRQVVIPLWASHVGLSATDSSLIYGIAGGIDALTFYPAERSWTCTAGVRSQCRPSSLWAPHSSCCR